MFKIPVRQCWERGLGIAICGAFGAAVSLTFVFAGNSSLAQITPDSTLPNNSNVQLNGSTFNITGGTQAGANLFHSFQEFSVPTNFTASFNNAADIQNILSRVTGGSRSNINGLIRANGTANLFLINPNGIIFGPNASLNIGGSFVGSTANAIQFDNNGIFSASIPEAPSPLLTINPSALLFNQIAAASIQNSSVAPAGQAPTGVNASGLRVRDGRSLLLVGGDIKMDGGRLKAYGGRVELGGLASPGTVGLGVDSNNLSLSFPDSATRADVYLTNQASVRVDAGGGGSIAVNARNIEILGGSFLDAGILEGLGSEAAVAGDITLNATGEIKIVGSDVFNNVRSQAIGNGGNISISSGKFSLTDGGRLSASTLGQGNAGNVSVRASDSISLVNGYIFSNVEAGGVGKGGNINIKAASLSLKDGAQLQTLVRGASNTQLAGRGDSGNVTVDVTGSVTMTGVKDRFPSGILSFVGTGATGNGGNITISSGEFSLTDGGTLSASTFGQGNAGNVSVRASGPVKLAGSNTRIFSTVEAGGVGKGGNIDIKAATLSLKDGAQLQTLVRQASSTGPAGRGDAGNVTVDVTGSVTIAGVKNGLPSGIRSNVNTGATSNGGNITIFSSSLSLTDGGILNTSTQGQGNAGSVSLQASNSVELVNGNILSVVALGGVGNGGNININAASLSLQDGALVQTSVLQALDNQPAGRGNAGNITVDVTGKVTIAGYLSSIGSFVGSEVTGNGGNITISSGSFSLTDNATLLTSTGGQGNAGSVSVRATDSVELVNGDIFSTVDAEGVGNGGNININATSLSLKDGARLIANTYGQGNAGNVSVQTSNSVELVNGKIFSTVNAKGVGNGGNININAASFSLKDGAQLQAFSTGRGNAGNITVDVTGKVTIAGYLSSIGSFVESEVTGNGGNITISSGSFSLTDNATLLTSTLGKGDAGSVSVRATDSVELVNGKIFSTVDAEGVGNGGNININATSVSLKDGARLSANTIGQGNAGNVSVQTSDFVELVNGSISSAVARGAVGKGGNIDINAASVSLKDGAQLNASTFGQGNAGSVSVRASDSVELVNGSIFNIVGTGAVVNGGNININAASLSLKDSSAITASSVGKGAAGNIEVDTRSIRMSDRSTISANTIAGQGNINLRPRDLLLLRRGSNITTNASGTATGGNITINTNNLLAVPKENSDISANAQESFGGRVNINTKSIFGIQFRQQNTLFSDITASSELGPQFSGSVEINTPDIDPTQGLLELRVNFVDASQQIDTSCRPDSKQQRGSFVITGRGSLRPSPYDMLTPEVVNLNLATLEPTTASHSSASGVSKETPTTLPEPIVEATGLVRNDKGEVFLVANSPVVTPNSPRFNPASCSARREAE